jgi:hypothetical protein
MSVLVEHRFETGHNIDFGHISILDKAAGYMDCMIKEVIKIRLHPRNFNWDDGFILSWPWYQVMNFEIE